MEGVAGPVDCGQQYPCRWMNAVLRLRSFASDKTIGFRRDRCEAVFPFLQPSFRERPLLAQSRHGRVTQPVSLLGVKRTWRFAMHMSAYDPKRTMEPLLSVVSP